jgi:hypothetical protein
VSGYGSFFKEKCHHSQSIGCQTADRNISQKEAAIEAVKAIGLNQIEEVKKEWFKDERTWEMFQRRLAVLKEV